MCSAHATPPHSLFRRSGDGRRAVRPRPRGVLSSGLLLLPGVLALAGCADTPTPAFQVGEAGYTDAEIRGLGVEQLELLGAVTAVALSREMVAPTRAGTLVLEAGARERRILRLREEVILEASGVTDADLEARYQAAPEYELEVRHLVLLAEGWASEADRERARSEAEAALRRILGGEPFAEVAAEVSEEPGAATRGGLLRPGRRGTWVEPFWEAALALPEGGTSGVVETPFGFHVLRLESRTPLPFAEARPRVVRSVAATLGGGAAWEEARERALDEVEIIAPEEAPRPTFRTALALAAGETHLMADPEAALARWPGGQLDGATFRAALLLRPAPELRRLGSDPVALEAALRETAETHRLDALARARGLDPSEEDRAAALRDWEFQLLEWATFLGLPARLSSGDEVAEASLAALRTTGQNARIAREELSRRAPALLGALPLRIPDPLP